MGLDVSHNAYSGSYRQFNCWRTIVAGYSDIKLAAMFGFGGSEPWDETHDLYPLLDHSDCDGEINWRDGEKIALALIDVARKMNDPHWHNITIQFAAGCLEAYRKKENLIFN